MLHFDFNEDVINAAGEKHLAQVADQLSKCKDARILISGNCDERGTEEYNLALGQRRASVAKEYLVSLGVDTSRIETVSYGDEKPVDDRHTEEAWALNRRDDLTTAP